MKLQEMTSDILADCLVANGLVEPIVKFVMEQHFDEFISLPTMRRYIDEVFFKQLPIQNEAEAKQYIDTVRGFDFFDKKNYIIPYDDNLYNFMNNLSSFRDELAIYIDIKFNVSKDRHLYKLVRQVGLPLEERKDIKATGRDYGCLRESNE